MMVQSSSEETNKNSKAVLYTILTAVITTLITINITAYLNNILWNKQWQSQLNEKSFDNKYSLIKDTATTCTKYQNYKLGAIRYMIMLKK